MGSRVWGIISAAGAVDREFYNGFFLIFDFFFDFGLQEVSQRRGLEILLQMGSGRARDDVKMPRSGTGTITTFSKN